MKLLVNIFLKSKKSVLGSLTMFLTEVYFIVFHLKTTIENLMPTPIGKFNKLYEKHELTKKKVGINFIIV